MEESFMGYIFEDLVVKIPGVHWLTISLKINRCIVSMELGFMFVRRMTGIPKTLQDNQEF